VEEETVGIAEYRERNADEELRARDVRFDGSAWEKALLIADGQKVRPDADRQLRHGAKKASRTVAKGI